MNEDLQTSVEKELSKHWHLDKKVPVATLIAIGAQLLALAWMASAMNSRIVSLEEYANELKTARLRERTAVIESNIVATTAKFNHIDDQLNRLEDKLDRIGNKLENRK